MSETRAKLAQLRRVRELSQGKVPAQSDLDAAEAAFERAKADEASARAAVSQAEATVKANETDLSKSVIRSPINGIVLTRSIEPGQTVAASFTAPVLFTLAQDLTQMELHVNVDEADIGKVREGQKATFSVAGYPNRTFEARITQARFGSSTTSGVVTYETVLKVNNSDLVSAAGHDGYRGHYGPKSRKRHPDTQCGAAFYPAGPGGEETGVQRLPRVWSVRCFRVRPVRQRNQALTSPPTKKRNSASGP